MMTAQRSRPDLFGDITRRTVASSACLAVA
jgi:hypothetical protein